MATFRSDFNSVPNTNRLTALKKQLTTCFQQWRQQLLLQLKNQEGLRRTWTSGASTQKQQQRASIKYYKLFSEKTKTHFKKFKLFGSDKDLADQAAGGVKRLSKSSSNSSKGRHASSTKVQIVANLFSSTLIDSSSSGSYSLDTSIKYYTRAELLLLAKKMTILEGTYMGVRDDYPDIDKEIRSILMANAQNGITISDIKKEYRTLTGTTFPLRENITDFLLTIPMVTAECNEIGTRIFNIKPTKKNKHLHDMIIEQRQRVDSSHSIGSGSVASSLEQPPRLWRSQYKRRALSSININHNNYEMKSSQLSKAPLQQHLATVAAATPQVSSISPMEISEGLVEQNWCYQDNWNHLNNQFQQAPLPQLGVNNICSDASEQLHRSPREEQLQPANGPAKVYPFGFKLRNDYTPPTSYTNSRANSSIFTINSEYDAYLLDFPLLGDDFFMYMARMELNCRFKKTEKVLQSGLCVSGQTIKAASRRLRRVELNANTKIIVNIGSVDILKGKPLVQIEHDFRQLINDMHQRQLIPVLTTLAPLANFRHDKEVCEKVTRFNNFIRKEGRYLTVIDIHSCLVNERGVLLFDCFQNGPRRVTGSSGHYVFWNKIGRQRVLKMIESRLDYY